MTERQKKQRAEHRAIEKARKVYNESLNGYSQRTALRRAFKKYEQERAVDEIPARHNLWDEIIEAFAGDGR